MNKLSKMSVQAVEALAKKNLLQWTLVKEALALDSKLTQQKLLSLKATELAKEVAQLKANKSKQ